AAGLPLVARLRAPADGVRGAAVRDLADGHDGRDRGPTLAPAGSAPPALDRAGRRAHRRGARGAAAGSDPDRALDARRLADGADLDRDEQRGPTDPGLPERRRDRARATQPTRADAEGRDPRVSG